MLKDKTNSLKEGQVNKRIYTQDMIYVALGWKNNYCKSSIVSACMFHSDNCKRFHLTKEKVSR